jgi:hypothetical protein
VQGVAATELGVLNGFQEAIRVKAPTGRLLLKLRKLRVGIVDFSSQKDFGSSFLGEKDRYGKQVEIGWTAEKTDLFGLEGELHLTVAAGLAELFRLRQGVDHPTDRVFLAGIAEGMVESKGLEIDTGQRGEGILNSLPARPGLTHYIRHVLELKNLRKTANRVSSL